MTPPEYPADLLARAARIRLIGFDVDGTLTDGGLLLDADGRETRRFDVQDGMGLVLLGRAGITVALVTARHGEAVRTRGKELGNFPYPGPLLDQSKRAADRPENLKHQNRFT